MLVMLSLAAGCVDAVGFLGLGQIFVANMTGNTVLLGLALGQAEGQAALRAVVALAGFVAGVGAGAAILGREQGGLHLVTRRHGSPRGRACLTQRIRGRLVPQRGRTGRSGGVSPHLGAGAGDGRTERRREAPGHTRRSDHLQTGTLTGLAEGAIERLRPAVASAVSTMTSGRETPSARGLLLPADVWLAYGMGAVIVGILAVRWPSGVLSVPVAMPPWWSRPRRSVFTVADEWI